MFTGRKIWFLVALYVNSVAIGVILTWMWSPTAQNDDPSDSAAPSFQTAFSENSTDSLRIEYTLNGGDQFFGLGDFEKAIEHYKNVLKASPADHSVQYRIALSMEASARFTTAFKMYRSIIETTSSSYLRRAAEIGVIRTQQKTGNPREAKIGLWRLFLRRDLPCSGTGEDPAFNGWITHQLATAYATSLLNRDTRISTDLQVPAFADLPFDSEFYLLDLKKYLLQVEIEKEKPEVTKPSGARVSNAELISSKKSQAESRLSKLGSTAPRIEKYLADIDDVGLANGQLIINLVGDAIDVEGKLIEIKARNAGLVEVFTTLESTLNSKIEFTPRAADTLRSHSLDIYLNQVDVATVLFGLTQPLGLYWVKAGDRFQVASAEELTPKELQTAKTEHAIHLLQSSIFDYPESRSAVGTQFVYGNLAFEQQDWSTAVGNYREAIKRRQLRHYLLQRTQFNLGKALLQLRQENEAENAFYAAIDDSFGGDLPAAALLIVSRLHILQGKFDKSIKGASRAISTAASNEFKERGALLLSSAYLLADKYYTANQSLVDNRPLIEDPRLIELAAFISAYARYVSQANHTNEEPEDLLRSLPPEDSVFEDLPHLPLLKGRALSKLGFENESVKTLMQCYSSMPDSKLRQKVKSEISSTLLKAGPYSELSKYYRQVFAVDPNKASHPELIQNAQFEFDLDNFENCKRICKQVLDNDPEPELRKIALRLLGQAYQRTGDPFTAATYFAGVYEKKNTKSSSSVESQNK